MSTLNLSGAGVGTLAAVGGSPLLFDLENNSFIHLDAQPAASNGFQGVVYQASSARAGGVELNPGMAAGTAALFGQILAYSFTTFGQPGTLDFRQAYGSGSVPGIATSGRNETSIISRVQLKAATGQPGFSTLTVSYTDEWAMDGYDAFVKVNNGVPIFFSQGIWSPPPSPGAPQPPPNNNPGDKFPANPSSVGSGSYVVKSSVPPDYIKTWLVAIVDDHSRFVVGLSDNGQPFVVWMPGVLTLFGKRLRELHIQHLRTQISSPWTNGKIEAFWAVLQQEVLDRQRFTSFADAETALAAFVQSYNYHRLSGTLGWLTPAERYDGTPFLDRGFENIPALAHFQDWLW